MAKPQITCLDFFKGLAPIFDETSLQTSELVNVSFQTSGLYYKHDYNRNLKLQMCQLPY
jgi:hypothetical protein